MDTPTLRIDVWSDVGCPWCYLGRSRLAQAVAASDHAESIVLIGHAFELDPSLAKPTTVIEYLRAKMRMSQSQVRLMEDKLAALAGAEGLPYTADRVHANSFGTHRLLKLAAEHDLEGPLLDRLQRELFSGREDVYDHGFQAGAAREVGISHARAMEVLAGAEFTDAVRQDEDDAQALGITGVPFTVLGERLAIPGAASVAGYAQAIEQAWAKADR